MRFALPAGQKRPPAENGNRSKETISVSAPYADYLAKR